MKNSFQDSIRRAFRQYAFIPILLLMVLFLAFYTISVQMTFRTRTRSVCQAVGDATAQALQAYSANLETIAALPEARQAAAGGGGATAVVEKFYAFLSSQHVRAAFYVLDADGSVRIESRMTSDALLHYFEYQYLPQFARHGGMIAQRGRLGNTDNIYLIGVAIQEGEAVLGYCVYVFDEQTLRPILMNQGAEIVLLTDRYDSIIAATAEFQGDILHKFRLQPNSLGFVSLGGKTYYLESWVLPPEQVRVLVLNSADMGRVDILGFFAFFGLLLLLLWFITSRTAGRISREVSSPIKAFIHSVEKLRAGDFNAYVEICSNDEFQVLAEQYNDMLRQVNELMEKNQELHRIRGKIELEQLKAQLNPHFLFNILETLRYTIDRNKSDAKRIVLILSRLLRYTLYNDGGLVTLGEDLGYLEDFLMLHKARFRDRLTYAIECAVDTDLTRVPKLVVQPLVENSIKYGYLGHTHVHIRIQCFTQGDELVLLVEDNGGGMAADRFEQVSATLQGEENQIGQLGIYNIHRMIRLLYGGHYGITMENRAGEGLKTWVRLPVITRD